MLRGGKMGRGEPIYMSKFDGQCHGDRRNGDSPQNGGGEGRESRIRNRETERSMLDKDEDELELFSHRQLSGGRQRAQGT
jgi:hypothetical protein